jgi:hypothetical protein
MRPVWGARFRADHGLTGNPPWKRKLVLPGAESSLLKDLEGPAELGVTSASVGFWINVHQDVRLHA